MGAKKQKMERIKEEYRAWLKYPDAASRRGAGLPSSKNQFAAYWKIDRTTLWHWEQDPDFMREISNEHLGCISAEDANRIIEGLKAKAFNGNVQAAKLLLEWAGLYGKNAVPPKDEPTDDEYEDFFDKMTPEELQAWIEAHPDHNDFPETEEVGDEEVPDDN